MSTRFPEADWNDFIQTIEDLGLAQHNMNYNVLSFLDEDKKVEIMTTTLDSLKSSNNLQCIDCEGKMVWILSTLADMFVYGKTEKEIIRIAEMYGKWLDVKETNKPKYLKEEYVKCAKIILGQLTLPFLNCKNDEKEIESHAEYCLIVVDIFYKLIDSQYGKELNEWILSCVYGIFVTVFAYFHSDRKEIISKTKQNKYYYYLLKRLINVLHFCLLKNASVSNNLWNVFISHSIEWQLDGEVLQQWIATTLCLQESYMQSLIENNEIATIHFIKNNGEERIIKMNQSTLQSIWLYFIKLSRIDCNTLTSENALIFQEGISLLMHDLSRRIHYNVNSTSLPPVDGNIILDLYGKVASSPLFTCDHDLYEEAICVSIGNILSFFAETLPLTQYNPKYILLLISTIQKSLSSLNFFVNKSCLDNLQTTLNYPLSGLTLSLKLIYSSIDSILNTSLSDKRIKGYLNAWVFRGFIKTLNNSLVHFNVYYTMELKNMISSDDQIETLLCTLIRKLINTDLVDHENLSNLCNFITTFFISFLPITPETSNFNISYNTYTVNTIHHLAWLLLFDIQRMYSIDKDKEVNYKKLELYFGILHALCKYTHYIPKHGENPFSLAVVQLVLFVLEKFIYCCKPQNIPDVFVHLLLYILYDYLISAKSLQREYMKTMFDVFAKLSQLFPSLIPQIKHVSTSFINKELFETNNDNILSIHSIKEHQLMQHWNNKALDHIRIVYKNGVLYSLIDLPQTDKTQLRCAIIERSCDGKFVFESSTDYVSTLGQIITKKENSVNSHCNGDKRVEGVPLFFSSSTKEAGQYPKQLEGDYQLHFKSFLMDSIPNEDDSVFSPVLGARLYHSCVIGIGLDDVELEVNEQLLNDLSQLDNQQPFFNAKVLIDFPPHDKIGQFFISFIQHLGKYNEKETSVIHTDIDKFILVQTNEANLICDCPKLFKTIKQKEYDLQIIWNCTHSYSPDILSKNVIIITPVSCNTFRIISKINTTLISDVYINGNSLSCAIPTFALHLFIQDCTTYISCNILRQKTIDKIVSSYKFNNNGRSAFIFDHKINKKIAENNSHISTTWTPSPIPPPSTPTPRPESINKVILPTRIRMAIEAIKNNPSTDCPLYHLSNQDLQSEKDKFNIFSPSITCEIPENPSYIEKKLQRTRSPVTSFLSRRPAK
ncbi:hypothetical protein EDI_166220 [Entamoeba dispar SAW760]|uniref:Uncharacterized protein n=1 Tax=Entamoeba dispar (strain ATCC PRA-260 / SAW760) TaxID=370354 RepID=B0EAE8_ENTDS|nr:uncharacterized protein EDI_166220 [Entamoeba dispar SAW760]EDR28502.1 hypothetical protein EDI_166220 [Entamoeba dispar SAW760]|eukprot:EDR28502.1 hypothetical protein EDI_166220 [Entamoeba dispar SAW760]